MKVVQIDLSKIEQNENSRVMYKDADLSELMASMKADGLLQPVGVMKSGNHFEAVYGNRRITAARKLGWSQIPAVITDLDTDIERDIVGLVENMKRSNTTAAEDGRMYKSLMSRGLKVTEIAARLGVTLNRVNAALDVINELPEEYHKRISFDGKSNRGNGRVSANAAITVLNIKKTANLNRAQTRQLMEYVENRRPSSTQLYKVAPMLKSGVSVSDAIERMKELERVSLNVYIPTLTVMKLEKKYGKKIHKIFYEYLAKHKAFHIERVKANSSQNSFRPKYKKNDSTEARA